MEAQSLYLLRKAKGQYFCEPWLIKLLLGLLYHITWILVGWISDLQALTADTQDGANMISLGSLKKSFKQTTIASRVSLLIQAREDNWEFLTTLK